MKVLIIDVRRTTLLSSSSTAASLRPRLLVVCGSTLQVDISSSCHVSHRRTSFTGRRAFSVARLMVWNSLPDYLRDTSLSEGT